MSHDSYKVEIIAMFLYFYINGQFILHQNTLSFLQTGYRYLFPL
jgi:hypothetical protein